VDQNSAALTMQQPSVGARNRGIAFHAAVFLTSFLILFSRRPDAVLNAQFYGEDGARWFADAYQFGWHCLFMPESGYLQTASRLIALLSLSFPFALAPLVMNLCALAVQILPVNLFFTSRFNAIPLQTRFLGSLLYLALPNSFEVHANTTNMQWHLALAGLLLLLGRAPTGRVWRVLSSLILVLSVLDGAAGILLAPVAVVLRWKRKDARSGVSLALLMAGAALQTLMILFSDSRRPAPNGVTIQRLVSIVGGQVFLSSIFGLRTSIQLFFGHAHYLFLIQTIALIAGAAIAFYTFRRGPIELKVLLCFAAAILVLALIRPVASTGGEYEQWEELQVPGVGNRYYFFPMLAFFASVIWMATGPTPAMRFARFGALIVLALLPIGIWRDWQYKPFVDYDFKAFAADFERAAPGTKVSIPINPNWQMVLTKR
jgi:hypothetical protein